VDDALPSSPQAAVHAAAWVAAGRAGWPQLDQDEQRFVAHVGACVAAGADPATLAAADLWLARACLDHHPAALRTIDGLIASLRPVVSAMKLRDDQIDELLQELRKKVLVGDGGDDGGRPRLADYSGRADLRTWLRTAATRAAIDVLRRRQDAALPDDDDDVLASPALAADPELMMLKARHRDQFRDAVTAAIGGLPPRDRALLRFHYVEGYAIDRIGAVYGVHRATAARWLVAAREALASATQRRLCAALGASPSEVRSLARLVESQLELSLRRLLPAEARVDDAG
jgi:RNA polymerase sigma-70 factor (ECF subfamily)